MAFLLWFFVRFFNSIFLFSQIQIDFLWKHFYLTWNYSLNGIGKKNVLLFIIRFVVIWVLFDIENMVSIHHMQLYAKKRLKTQPNKQKWKKSSTSQLS